MNKPVQPSPREQHFAEMAAAHARRDKYEPPHSIVREIVDDLFGDGKIAKDREAYTTRHAEETKIRQQQREDEEECCHDDEEE